MGCGDRTVVMFVAPSEDRLALSFELSVQLGSGWTVAWDYWSPNKISQLRCEGPDIPGVEATIKAMAQRLRLVAVWRDGIIT